MGDPDWIAGTEFSMARDAKSVAEKRNYRVTTVAEAKEIAMNWLHAIHLENAIAFGLPEVDDR